MLEQALQAAPSMLRTAEPEAECAPVVNPLEDIDAVHAQYEGRVFRFLLFSLRDRDAAMSLTQDTFFQAWRTRANFRGECSVATWLMRIALNLLRNHTRAESFKFWRRADQTAVDVTEMLSPPADPGRSAEESLAARQQLAAVWETVETLAPRQRTVFLLRFADELELPEIATVTGMPLPTVKTHLYRALDKVREAHRDRDKPGMRAAEAGKGVKR